MKQKCSLYSFFFSVNVFAVFLICLECRKSVMLLFLFWYFLLKVIKCDTLSLSLCFSNQVNSTELSVKKKIKKIVYLARIPAFVSISKLERKGICHALKQHEAITSLHPFLSSTLICCNETNWDKQIRIPEDVAWSQRR